MKILIIAHHFPPENVMGSLRPYSWAKYWSQLGNKVTVVTTQKYNFDAPSTLDLTLDFENLQVEEIDYLLAKKEGAKSSINKETKPKYTLGIFVKNIFREIRDFFQLGALISIRYLWIYPAYKKALSIYKESPYEIIVSTYGPPACHIIASLIKRRIPNVFWVADYRDLWSDDDSVQRNKFVQKAEWIIEKNVTQNVDFFTTVSSGLAFTLQKKQQQSVTVIENGFDLDDLSGEKFIFKSEKKIRLAYTGKIHPGKRNIEPLFQALKSLNSKRKNLDKKIILDIYSSDLNQLENLIKKYDISTLVKLHEYVTRKKSLKIQRSVSALVFLDWTNSSIEGVLTGKIFEYMYSGTPILGIGSTPQTAAGKLIEESRTGVCLGSSCEKISYYLERLLNGEEIFYKPSQEVLNRYTRKRLAEKMILAIIEAQQKKFLEPK